MKFWDGPQEYLIFEVPVLCFLFWGFLILLRVSSISSSFSRHVFCFFICSPLLLLLSLCVCVFFDFCFWMFVEFFWNGDMMKVRIRRCYMKIWVLKNMDKWHVNCKILKLKPFLFFCNSFLYLFLLQKEKIWYTVSVGLRIPLESLILLEMPVKKIFILWAMVHEGVVLQMILLNSQSVIRVHVFSL